MHKRRRTPSTHAVVTSHHISQPEDDNTLIQPQWEDYSAEVFDSSIFEDLDLVGDASPPFPEQQNGISHSISSDGNPTSSSPNEPNPRLMMGLSMGDAMFGDKTELHRSQIAPDTGHLNRYVMDDLMGHKDRLEISRIRLQRTQDPDEPQPLGQKAPILMVREGHQSSFFSPGQGTTTAHFSWSDVERLLSDKQREHLVRLFFRFVQPAFPILCDEAEAASDNVPPRNDASLALFATLYATALPFSIHNDYLNATLLDVAEKREELYSIGVAAILREAHAPSLETLQACLLLLQKGPTSQRQGLTPEYSWFTSLSVTIAKSLGLQYDCNAWTIPLSEKRLRTRLWWATFGMDLWISVDSPGGRSIGPRDYDVPLLRSQDEAPADSGLVVKGFDQFYHLTQLTYLLSEIHETYYTVGATKESTADLFKSLEFARPLRSALSECRQKLKADLPLNVDEDSGVCMSLSVHLACCVVSIVLFRALLRPLSQNHQASTSSRSSSPAANNHKSAAAAIMTGSVIWAREAVELLETMVSVVGSWNAFWHSWSQGNFAIVSTFLVQLLLMSNAEEGSSTRSEIWELISRWKRAIRLGAGSGGWGNSLMSMALSRLDPLLNHAAL